MKRELFPGVPWVESAVFDAHFAGADEDTRRIAEQLRHQGFAVIDFPDDEFGLVAEQIVAGLDGHFGDDARLMNVWKDDSQRNPASGLVRRLAGNPKMSELISRLFGRQAIPFQTLNFARGSQQRAHSDSAHFSSFPERFMCGVWIALEDVDEAAGPLIYHPGSHRLPILTNDQLGLEAPVDQQNYAHFEDAWEAIVASEGFETEPFLARRGQAGIWLANLLHGGAPIRDAALTRHSMVTHYFFEGCTHYTPLHSDPLHGKITRREPSAIRPDV